MKQKKLIFIAAIVLGLLTYGVGEAQTASTKFYQQMSPTEQANFVEEQARSIARQMSGAEYQFTPAFEMEIQRSIDRIRETPW